MQRVNTQLSVPVHSCFLLLSILLTFFYDYIAEVYRFFHYLLIIFLWELKKSQRMFILFQGLYDQRNFYLFSWTAATVPLWSTFKVFHSFFFFLILHFLLSVCCFVVWISLIFPFCLCSRLTLNRVRFGTRLLLIRIF